jgi:hypothetical protein
LFLSVKPAHRHFGQGKVRDLDGLSALLNECGDFQRPPDDNNRYFRFEIEIIFGNLSQLMIERLRRNIVAVQHCKKMVASSLRDSLRCELCNCFEWNGRAPIQT